MKRLVFLAVLFCGAVVAQTVNIGPVEIDVSHPTTRTDGSVLPFSEIANYRWYLNCSGTPELREEVVAADTMVIADLFPGNGTFEICHEVVDTGGRVSPMSAAVQVSVNIPISPPSTGSIQDLRVTCPPGTTLDVTQSAPDTFDVSCL